MFKFVLLLGVLASVSVSAFNPATMLALAAKTKAANEAAKGVSEIFQNLGDILKNDGEDIADKSAAQSQNIGILLDILKGVQDGSIPVSKRGIVPERDELKERVGRLYDRIRAYVNGGAEAGMVAYEEALGQLMVTYDRLKGLKSLSWLRRWIHNGIEAIEKKLDEYENEGKIVEKRELIPSREDLLEKIGKLYDRIQSYTNNKADDVLDIYRDMLDQARESFEKVERFKSLGWLKKWIAEILDRIDTKLQEYSDEQGVEAVEKREIIPSKEELSERLSRLYDRVRAYVNSGADTALDAYKESLDYIRYLVERFESMKNLTWIKKWIMEAMNRAERTLAEYEQRRVELIVRRDVENKREIIPSKEELLQRIGRLYNRVRAYVNTGAETALDSYTAGLDNLKYLLEQFDQFKSLDWFKNWVAFAVAKAERKLDEYETDQDLSRREVVPPKEEVLAKLAKLYDRLRAFVNIKSDAAIETYKGAIDEVREVYERIERFKSLGWLKQWIVNVLQVIDDKLTEWEQKQYERHLETRDIDSFIHDGVEGLSKVKADLKKALHGKMTAASKALNFALDELLEVYHKLEHSKGVAKLTGWLEKASDAVEKRVQMFIARVEGIHDDMRRDVTEAMYEHFDQRTARNIGDSVSEFFKGKWQKVNQTFVGFADKSKESWKELINEIKPIIAKVQNRGYEILEDTKQAATLVRESAIKTIDDTIATMLQTANDAVQDGKKVVDILKTNIEKIAKEL